MRGLERYYLKKQRTPKWALQSDINKLYKLSKKMGSNYQVDHIIPLASPFVCGLHCPDNLEIITEIQNIKKSNSYWPDMWHCQQELELEYIHSHQLSLNI